MFKPNTSFSKKTLTKSTPAKQIPPPSPTPARWNGKLEIVDHINTCAGVCIVNDIAINGKKILSIFCELNRFRCRKYRYYLFDIFLPELRT